MLWCTVRVDATRERPRHVGMRTGSGERKGIDMDERADAELMRLDGCWLDDPAIFEEPLHVPISSCDHTGLMTPPAIVDAFQDASTFHADAVGPSGGELARAGHGWVLTHWHIVIDRYPRQGEHLATGTFATRFRGMLGERSFYIRDAAGALPVRAWSSWGFIDVATGRLARPTPRDIACYATREALPMPPEARRVAVPADARAADPVRVRRHHIDVNEHMNNCQYVLIALDLLDPDERPRSIRVDYRRPARLGDVVVPSIARGDGGATVTLTDGDGALYSAVEFGGLR